MGYVTIPKTNLSGREGKNSRYRFDGLTSIMLVMPRVFAVTTYNNSWQLSLTAASRAM